MSTALATVQEGTEDFVDSLKGFRKDSIQFLNRCTKPDRREFVKISQAVAIGFLLMGFLGFMIKLVHIPIVNVLVSQ